MVIRKIGFVCAALSFAECDGLGPSSRAASTSHEAFARMLLSSRTLSGWQSLMQPNIVSALVRGRALPEMALDSQGNPVKVTIKKKKRKVRKQKPDGFGKGELQQVDGVIEDEGGQPFDFGINFEDKGWKEAEDHLNTCPVFTCVDGGGNPMGYKDKDFPDRPAQMVFFMGIESALAELQQQKEAFPELEGLQLMPVGLGAAFQAHAENMARLFPGQAALDSADDDWDDRQCPVYTCLELKCTPEPACKIRGLAADEQVIPIFLDPRDAQKSLEFAKKNSKEKGMPAEFIDRLSLVTSSLHNCISLVTNRKEVETCGARFQFVSPRSSLLWMKQMNKINKQIERNNEQLRIMAEVEQSMDEGYINEEGVRLEVDPESEYLATANQIDNPEQYLQKKPDTGLFPDD